MKIALVVTGASGHLFPMLSLANQLKLSDPRGREIIICSHLDGQEKIEAAGFKFYPFAKNIAPKGFFNSIMMKNSSGIKGLFHAFNTMNKVAESEIEDIAEFISKEKPALLLIDNLQPASIVVSEKYQIPYFLVSTSFPMGFDANIPPIVTSWKLDPSLFSKVKNRMANYAFNKFLEFTRTTTNKYAKKNNIPKLEAFDGGKRNYLGYITQIFSQFDYPQKLPENVYYSGPFVKDSVRKKTSNFPWEKLNGKPLVYASLGTVANNKPEVFKQIAIAFENIEAQLIMSVGDRVSQEEIDAIPGEHLIVRFAPQLEILEKAKLFITHAGMNSTLESLRAGVPMLALPQMGDQPGVAARIKYVGAGEFILAKDLTVSSIREGVKAILNDAQYQQKAIEFSQLPAMQNGCKLAADIIESKINSIPN